MDKTGERNKKNCWCCFEIQLITENWQCDKNILLDVFLFHIIDDILSFQAGFKSLQVDFLYNLLK